MQESEWAREYTVSLNGVEEPE